MDGGACKQNNNSRQSIIKHVGANWVHSTHPVSLPQKNSLIIILLFFQHPLQCLLSKLIHKNKLNNYPHFNWEPNHLLLRNLLLIKNKSNYFSNYVLNWNLIDSFSGECSSGEFVNVLKLKTQSTTSSASKRMKNMRLIKIAL